MHPCDQRIQPRGGEEASGDGDLSLLFLFHPTFSHFISISVQFIYILRFKNFIKGFPFQVINALKTERDVSVRQRAVDLLYAM